MPSIPDIHPYPWDPERLKLIAATPEQERMVIGMLLEQGKKALSVMESSMDDPSTKWKHAAHGLAGTAVNLGMNILASYCKEGEAGAASHAVRVHTMEKLRTELQRIADHNLTQKDT